MSSKYKIHPVNTSSPKASSFSTHTSHTGHTAAHTAASTASTAKHNTSRSSFSQSLSRNVSNNNLTEDEGSLLFEDQALSESGKNFGRGAQVNKLKRFNSFSSLSLGTNTNTNTNTASSSSSATAASAANTAGIASSSHNGASRYTRTVNEIRSSPHTAISVLLSPSLPRSARKSLSQSQSQSQSSSANTRPQNAQIAHTQPRSRGNSANEDSVQALLNGSSNGNGNGTSSRRNSLDGTNRRRLGSDDEITEISLTVSHTQVTREGTRSRLNSSDNTHTNTGNGVSRTPSTHSQKSSLRKPHNHTSHTHTRRKRVQFRSPIADYSECRTDYDYGPDDEDENAFSFSQSISAIPRRLMRKQSQRELQAGGGCMPGCVVM